MNDVPRILGIIPARGGSKGVPRKNVRCVAGKPLIGYTIEAAQGASRLSRVVVSTEDAEISAVARACGVEVLPRPVDLAADDTPGIAPVLHAMEQMSEYDYVVLLQPTSPLRTALDIDAAIETCMSAQAPACVSVSEAAQSPYWMFRIEAGGKMQPLLSASADEYSRRQNVPPAYALNGAVYVAVTDWLRERQTFLTSETVAYTMPQERSLDIDSEWDFLIFGLVLEKKP
ncbi:acylneuraminate cytidylyltransferase family protein [Nitrococcus mobilis]|uniref:Acylneuraminate cytidylyltransferase n=1 Tax=Nitrococcus mobilis Nb-231 TaxID=314278 RepID=A4BMG6_9GAMM|nr:acylneuraminate cytidylyltransferase family protein [Nitrococcus mobilis]EAR23504.1 acylneuraminate cytidylyltransferase [Nitrococcus mobilis Nb-231]